MRVRESDRLARLSPTHTPMSTGLTIRFLCDGCNTNRPQLGRKRIKRQGVMQWRCATCLKPKETG